MEKTEYVTLGHEDFNRLVRGDIVHIHNVKIALQDIGFVQMKSAIQDAMKAKEYSYHESIIEVKE